MSVKPLLSIARPIGHAKKAGGSITLMGMNAPAKKLDKEVREKIFERDNHTCQCCGFKAEKYQDIIFLNSNPTDRSEGNLATACIFCHQCFNLEDVGIMKSGVLVWLPEIEQTTLHHIARAIYVARIAQGPISDTARKTLDILMDRKEEAQKRLGTDKPDILASVMRDYLGERHYAARVDKLEGIRLFPLDRRIIKEADLEFNQFPQILAYWRSKNGPFGGKTPQTWPAIYKEIAG